MLEKGKKRMHRGEPVCEECSREGVRVRYDKYVQAGAKACSAKFENLRRQD